LTTYGLTAAGFVAKPVEAIIADMQAAQASTIDSSINTSATGVIANLNASVAQQLAQCWELAQEVYDSHDPNSAEGVAADHNGALSGVTREDRAKSVVTLRLSLDAGTTVIAGSVVSQDGQPSVRFVTLADAAVVAAGDVSVQAEAEEYGAIAAGVHTLTVIESPSSGWTAVTNDAEATAGRDVEQDEPYRLRRVLEIASQGGSTVDGVVADVRKLDGVISVGSIENEDDIEVDGVPAHSFEIIVRADGATDQEIADCILKNKPGGIRAFGSTVVTATDSEGVEHSVGFTHASLVRINVNYHGTFGSSYAANGVRDAIEAEALDPESPMYLDIGTPVYLARVLAAGLTAQGVVNLTLDVAKHPTVPLDAVPLAVDAVIAITGRQIAYFDHTLSWVQS
jgi:uncharacterized phage protein gp47/JayE